MFVMENPFYANAAQIKYMADKWVLVP